MKRILVGRIVPGDYGTGGERIKACRGRDGRGKVKSINKLVLDHVAVRCESKEE